MDVVFLISLFVVGWIAAALLGSQAYFRGEQSKPIHERNWRSDRFDELSALITNQETDFQERVPGYVIADAYGSNALPTNS